MITETTMPQPSQDINLQSGDWPADHDALVASLTAFGGSVCHLVAGVQIIAIDGDGTSAQSNDGTVVFPQVERATQTFAGVLPSVISINTGAGLAVPSDFPIVGSVPSPTG